MNDLIKRSDAISALHKYFSSGFDCDRWWNSTTVLFALNNVPSANIPQGEWLKNSEWWGVYKCSLCRKTVGESMNYCPHCGARMKVADDDY